MESTKKKKIGNFFKSLLQGKKERSKGITIKAEAPIVDNALKLGNTLLGLFKDRKGKLSSKRTITGILATAAVQDMAINGITYLNLILAALAVVPIIFTTFEKN